MRRVRVLVASALALAASMAGAQGLPGYITGETGMFNGASHDPSQVARLEDCLKRTWDEGPEACLFRTRENACFDTPDLSFEAYSQCFLVEAAGWDLLVQGYYDEALETAAEHDDGAAKQGAFAGAQGMLVASQEIFGPYRWDSCKAQWASQAGWDNGPDRNYALCMVRLTAQRAHQLYAWGQI